jgi:hypothetical protein
MGAYGQAGAESPSRSGAGRGGNGIHFYASNVQNNLVFKMLASYERSY